jgi:DNA phosphorothioation-dependent restriction protein DptG
MSQIELKKSGPNSIEARNIKKKSFSHNTGNQFKILPFKTNPSGDVYKEDFKSFQGIIGELFRTISHKSQIESTDSNVSYKSELKQTIITNAIDKVETENIEELSMMLSNLFFDEQNGLIKFNSKTLCYMNNINPNNAIKEISLFIFDLFIKGNETEYDLGKSDNEENLLHQLILESLPELPTLIMKGKYSPYKNLFHQIKEQFKADLSFVEQNNEFYLKHVEDLFKYYYFHYLSQLVLRFNNFGVDNGEVKPLYYTLEWETLSETRLSSHSPSWKNLDSYSPFLFAHSNALELLNYILVDGKAVGDYNDIAMLYESLSPDEKVTYVDSIEEIISLYKSTITLKSGSWEDCYRLIDLELSWRKFESHINQNLFKLWFCIKYQFENTDRKGADLKYARWFIQFAKVNYTKSRGRLGSTTVLSQELLLFITRVCIGNEEKIRLKLLWDRLKDRGIVFDETSKLAITKLFERINLIEKKSDSGDAQYVKSTI